MNSTATASMPPLTNLHTLISLASLCDEGGLLVDRMIQVAIAGLAVAATWESLQAPGWTEPQLATLQSDWQRLDIARGFAHTVEMERANAISDYDLFRTNSAARRDMFRGFGRGGGVTGRLYENFYLPIWAGTWSKGDELKFLQSMQPIVEGVRRASTHGNYHTMRATFTEALRDIQARQTAFNKFRFPMASMVVPNWEKAATSLLRYETQRQMALTALALKRYQLQHRRLPPDLASLTPQFLSAPPVDYLNGRLLTYQRLSDERFTLRSSGNNGQDEDGAGDDLIWPEAENDSPAESPARP